MSRLSRTKHAPSPDQAVEAAIARVLAAEDAARAAVLAAEQEASATAEAARAAVRALVQRTDARIARVRAAFEVSVCAQVAALAAEAQALGGHHPLTPDERAALERALATLAAELVAGPP